MRLRRKVAPAAASSKSMQNMTVVRIANLPSQVTEDDLMELVSLVDTPVNINFWYSNDHTVVCEVRIVISLETSACMRVNMHTA